MRINNYFLKGAILTLAFTTIIAVSNTNAQFSGSCYAIPNWTLAQQNGGNGFVNTRGAPAIIVLTGPNGTGGNSYTHYTAVAGFSGTVSFNWSVAHSDGGYDAFGYSINGATFFIAQYSGSGSTTFSVNAGDVFGFYGHSYDGCCGTFNATITNFTAPCTPPCVDLDLTSNFPGICVGDGNMIILNAVSTNGGNITWDNGVTDGVPFLPGSMGVTTYTATSDDMGDCPTSIDISYDAVPVVTAMANILNPCSGTDVIFNGGGATTYTWDNGVIDNVPSEVNGSGITTYTVTGTTGACSDTETIDLDLKTQPVVNAMASANPICLGDMLTLTSSGDALSYSWGTLIDEGVAFQPTFTGTYNVTGVNSFGCYTTTGITVVVNSLPVVDAGADQVACQGESVVLSGNNALTYVWNNGVTNAVPFTAAVVGANTYQVTGTDANGCDDIDQVTITVMEAPVITAVVVNEENGFDGSIDLTVTGGTGNYDYSWAHGYMVADISGLTSTMTYTVTVSDGICESDSTFTILNVLGVENVNDLTFAVYPNPTTENITITIDGAFNFFVADMTGKVISSGNGNGQETISMATFADGSYLLTVLSNDITRTTQVIKQ